MRLSKHLIISKLIILTTLIFTLGATQFSKAQSSTVALSPYTLEFEPVLGILLPYDIWGTPGTLKTVGIRSSYVLSAPDGAIEVSALYHHAKPDKAYMIDAAWRQEMQTELLLAYFSIGLHYSKWDLKVDYEADGETCIPRSCTTDSGIHSGLKVGAGVQVPLGPNTPLKLGMIFYNGPQLLLLLEAGVGIRF